MCIYKKRHKIYEFSASVHLKFSKTERAVISKKYLFSSEVHWEHSVHTSEGVMPHSVFCVSSVFKYITDFYSCSPNSQLFLYCLFFLLCNSTRALGGHMGTSDSSGVIDQVPTLEG